MTALEKREKINKEKGYLYRIVNKKGGVTTYMWFDMQGNIMDFFAVIPE